MKAVGPQSAAPDIGSDDQTLVAVRVGPPFSCPGCVGPGFFHERR